MRTTPRADAAPRRRSRRGLTVAFVLVLSLVSSAIANATYIGIVVPDAEAPGADEWTRAVAVAADQGALLAEEEFGFNAELFGLDFAVLIERASGADAVVAAAERLVTEEGVLAVVGGFSSVEAAALAAWSAGRGVPFLNVGASDDRLRHELCAATAYHVEPSAAMYLDALVGWYVRSGFRSWYFVVGDDDESVAQYERTLWSMRERHFGARDVGRITLARNEDAVVQAVRRANADLVVLLLPAAQQLALLESLERDGVTTTVAGFPYHEAQTRTFFAASREVAPTLGSDHRAMAWEATLDAYGAREINARFLMRFGDPMEAAAWATYQGVKVAFEGATLGGTPTPEGVMAFIDGPQGIFDIWKGIGVSFRSWDRQLRQSLYLVKISPTVETPFELATLVGELPAIYMPGTDPVERLDQLGDLRDMSRCRP